MLQPRFIDLHEKITSAKKFLAKYSPSEYLYERRNHLDEESPGEEFSANGK
jgi:hypothetical protein